MPSGGFQKALSTLRPIEWATLTYGAVLYSWVGYQVDATLFFSRAAGVLAALGLVVAGQQLWRFTHTPWHPAARRPLVWFALIASTTPWLFALVTVSQSRVASELSRAALRDAISDVTTLFLAAANFGLPLVLLCELWANQVRQHGEVTRERTTQSLRFAAAVLRDWAPLLIIISIYGVVSEAPAREFDTEMIRADHWLFLGRDPQDLIQPFITTARSEVLAAIYSFYAVMYPLVLCTAFATGGRPALQRGAFSLGFALLLAYVSYELFPVKGPLMTRTFDVPLDLYIVGPVKEAMMDKTRLTWDCFPSMHTCCTLLLGEVAWRWSRRLLWVISPAVVLMPVACVYLRYHYVIDIVAGAALAAVLIAITRWHFAKRPAGYP